MGRRTNHTGTTKTIAASTTVVFNSSEIDSTNVIGHRLTCSGAGNTLVNMTRVRVKANGTTIHDYDPSTTLRAWVERFSNSNLAYATSRASFTIPYNFADLRDEDAADLCQFPLGALCTIEVTFGAGAGAGSLMCGWTKSNITPRFWNKIYSQTMGNITASMTNGRYQFTDGGIIAGYCLNTTGLDRARFVLGDNDVDFLPGPSYNGLTIADMGLESQALDNPSTVTNPMWKKLLQNSSAPSGSYLELTTQAGWSVTSPANELGLYVIERQQG